MFYILFYWILLLLILVSDLFFWVVWVNSSVNIQSFSFSPVLLTNTFSVVCYLAVPYSFSNNLCGMSPLKTLLAFWLIYMYNFMVRKYSSIPVLLSVFIRNRCCIMVNVLSASVEMNMSFLFKFMNIGNYINDLNL